MEQVADLFEDIRDMLMCDYLSDLRSSAYMAMAKKLMKAMDVRPYSLNQLSDMAQYLYGYTVHFHNQEDAALFFSSQE